MSALSIILLQGYDRMNLRPIKWPDVPSANEFSRFVVQTEVQELLSLFPDAKLWYAELEIGHSFYDYFADKLYHRGSRRGEIAFAIRNPQKEILVHTKAFYPQNVFRIPTGGIHLNEPVPDAMRRELYEETGLKDDNLILSDMLFLKMVYDDKFIPFISYIYSGQIDRVKVVSQDPSEQIEEFKWLNEDNFTRLVQTLEQLKLEWADWGKMRAVVHQLLQKK